MSNWTYTGHPNQRHVLDRDGMRLTYGFDDENGRFYSIRDLTTGHSLAWLVEDENDWDLAKLRKDWSKHGFGDVKFKLD